MNKLIYALCAASTLALAAPAIAQSVTANSNGTWSGPTTINFNGNVDGQNVAGLSASLALTTFQILNGDYVFGYTLTNTSGSPVTASRVSGLAFNTNPNITGGSASGLFTNLFLNGNYPNGVGNVEVCLGSGGNSCAGGGSGGVTIGQSGTGTFTLDFGATTPTSITLNDFFVRYQAITAPGMTDGSGTGSPVGTPRSVPEPATWAMMLLGFSGIGMAIRRRRNQNVLAQVA